MCADIFFDPVHCSCTATFCQECIRELDTCPICRADLNVTPNKTMSSFLDLLEFKCPWQDEGCTKTPAFGNLVSHLHNCSTHFCLLCREIRGNNHTGVTCLQNILRKVLKWIDKVLLNNEEYSSEIDG